MAARGVSVPGYPMLPQVLPLLLAIAQGVQPVAWADSIWVLLDALRSSQWPTADAPDIMIEHALQGLETFDDMKNEAALAQMYPYHVRLVEGTRLQALMEVVVSCGIRAKRGPKLEVQRVALRILGTVSWIKVVHCKIVEDRPFLEHLAAIITDGTKYPPVSRDVLRDVLRQALNTVGGLFICPMHMTPSQADQLCAICLPPQAEWLRLPGPPDPGPADHSAGRALSAAQSASQACCGMLYLFDSAAAGAKSKPTAGGKKRPRPRGRGFPTARAGHSWRGCSGCSRPCPPPQPCPPPPAARGRRPPPLLPLETAISLAECCVWWPEPDGLQRRPRRTSGGGQRRGTPGSLRTTRPGSAPRARTTRGACAGRWAWARFRARTRRGTPRTGRRCSRCTSGSWGRISTGGGTRSGARCRARGGPAGGGRAGPAAAAARSSSAAGGAAWRATAARSARRRTGSTEATAVTSPCAPALVSACTYSSK